MRVHDFNADNGEFAVESIRRWWQNLGRTRYATPRRLTITAERGGSNGARVKLWKRELQRFADETVCCEIDPNIYPKAVLVSEQEMQAINLTRAEFHGEWNYTIAPNQQHT